jgi:hypothetical protein
LLQQLLEVRVRFSVNAIDVATLLAAGKQGSVGILDDPIRKRLGTLRISFQ